MATFHQNLVQSFTNFKNKYMRSYDTWADAQSDIANIPEGGRFFTKDAGSTVPINARNVRYDDGTQAGSDVETQIQQIYSDLIELEGKFMRDLDFTSAEIISANTAAVLNYTTSKSGALYVGTKANGSTSAAIMVDGIEVAIAVATSTLLNTQWVYGIPAGSTITSNLALAANSTLGHVTFVPYKTN